MKKKIFQYQHPSYTKNISEWKKFRLAFEGGRDFINQYLRRYSNREDYNDFNDRKAITYCPAHAKAAILDIKNAIFQRMVDINRSSGSKSWREACDGEGLGVDLNGNSMTSYIGRIVLPEMLMLGKVGVYIDKPQINGITKKDAVGKRPYIYLYAAESILSWSYSTTGVLRSVLLLHHEDIIEKDLIVGTRKQYRHFRLMEDVIEVDIYDNMGELVKTQTLNLSRIPFVICEISEALMKDIADYQIALLNMASPDIMYSIKSNFPFYVEQYSPQQALGLLMRQAVNEEYEDNVTTVGTTGTGTADAASKANDPEIKVGTMQGRRYPAGMERPAFIHPSAEPLEASMKKQDKLIQEIRQLVNLAVSNIAPQRASAESKKEDTKSLEAGLSYIGLELEYCEREIAKIWNMYEGERTEPVIKYPSNYSLRDDEDRRKEAKELNEMRPVLPSLSYQKVMSKEIAQILLGTKISKSELEKIYNEIDAAKVINIDHETIRKDHEAGFVGTELASITAGYPEGESEKAKLDHAERAANILKAQMSARGVSDLDNDPEAGKKEKDDSQNPDLNPDGKKKVRGEGK